MKKPEKNHPVAWKDPSGHLSRIHVCKTSDQTYCGLKIPVPHRWKTVFYPGIGSMNGDFVCGTCDRAAAAHNVMIQHDERGEPIVVGATGIIADIHIDTGGDFVGIEKVKTPEGWKPGDRVRLFRF